MFSGIIQAIVPVCSVYNKSNSKSYVIDCPKNLLLNLNIGCSVSNNGCCLTVTAIQNNLVSFNVIYETIKLTNMNILKVGDLINIEKSIHYHDEIGGHLMTGHIDCTGEIRKIINVNTNKIMWIKIKNKYFQKYIIPKGSIGIEGISLTINKVLNDHIRICLTPYTIKKTNLGIKKVGNLVNIEIDLIVKTIIYNTDQALLNIKSMIIK